MNAKTIWLIAAASLILVGGIVFVCVMGALKWDFSRLATSKLQTNSHPVTEPFEDIRLKTDTARITFVLSEDESCLIECKEHENQKHTVKVEDGVLTVELVDTRRWYEYISIGFSTPSITVSLPKRDYGALFIESKTGEVMLSRELVFASMDIQNKTGSVTNLASAMGEVRIKTTTGHVEVEGISAGSLALSVTTGRVRVTDVTCSGDASLYVSTGDASLTNMTCKSFSSNGDTGDILLTNLIAEESLSIERDTGDVTLAGCDAAELFVTTDTGDVNGSLLTEKVFIAQSDTGRVEVPRTVTGGRCEITTDTGDIKISIQ